MKNNFSKYFLITSFVLIFFGLSVSFFVMPDKSFSEDENRALSTFPEFSFDKLFFDGYTSELSDYCSDQFPFRSLFVNLKAVGELALLKGENNNILLGKDGMLMSDPGIANEKLIKENLSHIGAFAEKFEVPVYTTFVPTSSYVLREALPFLYPVSELEHHYEVLGQSIPKNVKNIDVNAVLSAHSSEYIYYSTDHHTTSLGAYYVYAEIIRSLGKEPYAIEDFERQIVSEEFFGTTWSFAGIPFVSPDEMEFFRFKGDEDYLVEINKKSTRTGLYDFTALDTKDKYSAFISNTVNGLIKISSENNSETLVIVKDSFAHAVAPFLARHYNIVMIDPRYHAILRGSIDKIVEEENASAVLVLVGAQGIFDGSGKLSNLRNN